MMAVKIACALMFIAFLCFVAAIATGCASRMDGDKFGKILNGPMVDDYYGGK